VRNVCPRMDGYRRCNNCGKEGHSWKDCPTLARAVTRRGEEATCLKRQATGEEATGLRRQVECMLCQERRQQAQVTLLFVVV